jgi:hypothetical protein
LKALHAGSTATRARRPKRLLSGLVTCGCCGAPYIVIDGHRLGCSGRKEGRDCTDARYIRIDVLERAALEGLRRHLLAPEAVSAYVREYHRLLKEERSRGQHGARAIERRLTEIDAKIARMVGAIADGTDSPALRIALTKAEAERAALVLAREEHQNPVASLAPDLGQFYRRQVETETLSEQVKAPDLRPRAVAILRDLIERLVLYPGEERGSFTLELHGHLAGLVRFASGQTPRSDIVPKVLLSLAERGGFERSMC